jgi:hypothetical protein
MSLSIRTLDRRFDVGQERGPNVIVVYLLRNLAREGLHLDPSRGDGDT